MSVAVGVDEAAQMGFYDSGHTCGINTTLNQYSTQVLEGDVIKPTTDPMGAKWKRIMYSLLDEIFYFVVNPLKVRTNAKDFLVQNQQVCTYKELTLTYI